MIEKNILKLFIFTMVWCQSIAVNSRYYPRYHLAPPHGWMNDPNGFCLFKNEYHLFYQYNPETSQEPGVAHWGHSKSKDLFNWEHLPIAMYPDQWYDRTGVFSGSALIENDTMYLYYTGNVNRTGETPNKAEYQALAISTDGINIKKYEGNPIIYASEHQPNIRDPKVWKHQDVYYMVIGNSFDNDTKGRIILYSSKDKINWEEKSIIDESDGSFGYMWECPDLFELNGKFVLLFSPQGVPAQGDKYRNLYQSGYMVGSFDFENNLFSIESKFKEIDHGHSFYATQTTLDHLGRRLMVAWFNMWEDEYVEKDDGWNGQMTLVRELILTPDNKIIQKPVDEVYDMTEILYKGYAAYGEVFKLKDKSGLVSISTSSKRNFELFIEGENQNSSVLIGYDYRRSRVTLDRGGEDGVRRTTWRPRGRLQWNIYVDASSIELFCGKGEVTFSSRFYPEGQVYVRMGKSSFASEFSLFSIQRTVDVPDDEYY